MSDEAGLIDAPAEPEVAAVESTPVETESTEVEATDGEESQESGAEGETLRGSALWRETKSLAQSGKPLTPKLLSALNKVIHRNEAFESKYPTGLSAIEASMSAVRQLASDENVPIEKVIEETLSERNYFRDLDAAYTAGKPEFVEKLATASPEAFQNIAPSVFRKYAEVNPEGYSAYVAQAVVQHMGAAEVPLQFRILASFLPQLPDSPIKEQVLNAVESLYAWSEGLKAMAQKKVEPKVVPGQEKPAQNGDREAQLAQREMNATRMEWNSSIKAEGINFVMSEAAKAAGKTPLTEKEKQTVLAKVSEELDARLTADKRYGEAMQASLKSGNRSAYLQRIKAERQKLIPGAVRRAVGDVVDARPKAPAKQPANAASTRKPATEMTGATQYRRIGGHPKAMGMTVDLNRTTNAMLQKRVAYVAGQKEPVTWNAPAK